MQTKQSQFFADVTRMALVVGYGCVQGLQILLFIAYKLDTSPYVSNHWAVFFVYQGFLVALPVLISRDGTDLKDEMRPVFSPLQAVLTALVVLANALMTIVAVVDAESH
jgi:hypothetical protein